jgi:hypothetical protein
MKYIIIGSFLAVSVALTMTGCNGIKASTDNAEVQKGAHLDANGKVTDSPEVSVPIWSSKGLKPKPQDVTPPKS